MRRGQSCTRTRRRSATSAFRSTYAVGYELAWDILVLVLLLLLANRWLGRGVLFWTYILLYSVGRYWISFYRVDTIVALGLRQAQLVALVGILLGAIALAKLLVIDHRERRTP